MNGPDDDDVMIDLALRERLGGEAPPDLVEAVRARAGARPAAGRPHRLAAALALVGAAVVCGVAVWTARGDRSPATDTTQEPATRRMPTVSSPEDVAALPVSTRAVEVIGGDDHVIEALLRLHNLETLVVREPWNEAFGLSLETTPLLTACPVTNVSWAHIAKLSKLRRLEFSGTLLVGRLEGPGGPDVIKALERLPLLETLSLRFLHTANAVLERLPRLAQLQHLDLSFNHGFTEEGIQAIAKCRSLRSLSLRGCQQLHSQWLVQLDRLEALERLDVSALDGINWWAGTGFVDDAGLEIMRKARGWADSLNAGVQDGAIAAFARLPRLRVLEIGGGRWTPGGLHALGASTTLEELGMTGGQTTGDEGFVAYLPKGLVRLEVCGPYRDDFCAAVREHLKKLRQLSVAACDQITDAGIRELVAIESLRDLDLRQMRGLTATCVDDLVQATQLRRLDLRHCSFVTAVHVERLRRALPGLTLEATVPVEAK